MKTLSLFRPFLLSAGLLVIVTGCSSIDREKKENSGSTCSFDGDCSSGVCNYLFQCTEPASDGTTCRTDGECHSGHCSFGSSTRVCRQLVGYGSPCQNSTDCESGYFCGSSDVCQ